MSLSVAQSTENRFAQRARGLSRVAKYWNSFYLGEGEQDTADSVFGARKTSMEEGRLGLMEYLACSWGSSSRWST